MSIPPNPTPGVDLPDDPEEAVAALTPETGEDYDPPEVVDLDREASELDQLEQAIEVPVLEDGDEDDDGEEL